MAIYVGSRYETATKQTVIGTDGVARAFVFGGHAISVSDVGSRAGSRRSIQGEMLDEYAFDIANKERNWWVIAQINDVNYPLTPLDENDARAELVANRNFIVPPQQFLARF